MQKNLHTISMPLIAAKGKALADASSEQFSPPNKNFF